jgi:DNA-binding protein HU-beta
VNKGDLVLQVAKSAKISQRQARQIIDATFDTIKKNTKKRGGVQLAGFGSFSVSKRKARMGRNPQTGEAMKISASKNVRFKAGKAFKGML